MIYQDICEERVELGWVRLGLFGVKAASSAFYASGLHSRMALFFTGWGEKAKTHATFQAALSSSEQSHKNIERIILSEIDQLLFT